MATILLVGRTQEVLRRAAERATAPGVSYAFATTLEGVQAAMGEGAIAHVVVGGGLPTETRLAVVETVLRTADATTLHLKDAASGPDAFEPFLRALVTALQP